jgi:hypothetical protein
VVAVVEIRARVPGSPLLLLRPRTPRPSRRSRRGKESVQALSFLIQYIHMLKQYKQSGIEITGEAVKDIKKIAEAVLFLESDSTWKKKVRNLKQIIVHSKNSYDNELFYRGAIWVCQRGTVREATIPYLASLIAHEIFHILQDKRGMDNINSRMEPAAYNAQIRFLEKYGTKRDVWWVSKLLKEKYWEGQINMSRKGKEKIYVSPFLKCLDKVKRDKIFRLKSL